MSRIVRLMGLLLIAVLAAGASAGTSTAEPLDDPSPEITRLASDATAWPCAADGCDCEGEACDDGDIDWAVDKIRQRCSGGGGVAICCDGPGVRMCGEIRCYD